MLYPASKTLVPCSPSIFEGQRNKNLWETAGYSPMLAGMLAGMLAACHENVLFSGGIYI